MATSKVLTVAALAVAFKLVVVPLALPHGPAAEVGPHDRPRFAPVDFGNDSLRAKHGKLRKIYERPSADGEDDVMKGPETVVFGNDGTMYVMTEQAKLVSLTDFKEEENGIKISAKATEVMDLGMGRPLGGKFAKDGILYMADTLLGLVRVRPPLDEHAKVELVASRVKLANGNWSQILYADDVDIGPKSGNVYFSDATDLPPARVDILTWDTLYTSKIDYGRGKRAGRLLKYDPEMDEVSVLASGIWFANGIAVDKDETFVMVSETFAGRQLKYHLQGPKKDTLEVMAEDLPGYPDGADCSFETGLCYAPLPSSEVPIMKTIFSLPHPIDMMLRTVIMMMPRKLVPKVIPYGGVAEIFPGDAKSPAGRVIRVIQDPTGEDIGMLTGVTVHNKKLYLGSLLNSFVGVYELD